MPDAFGVEWAPSARRDLAKLAEKVATAVVEFSYGGLAGNPQPVGRELHLELSGLHAARRGDFRVIYCIDRTRHRVVVIAIDHLPALVTQRSHDDFTHPAPLLAARMVTSTPLRQPYTTVPRLRAGECGAAGGVELPGA